MRVFIDENKLVIITESKSIGIDLSIKNSEIKTRIQKIRETADSRCIYQSELDKICFRYDTAYRNLKDLPRRTAVYRALRDKAFNIAKNPGYGGYQGGLASMVYTFFDKKTEGGATKNEIMPNKKLVKELHKQIIRKFEKRKVHSSFIDNIWGVDLAHMQLLSKFNKEIRSLLRVIYIYSKYDWFIPLKDKKMYYKY